MQIDSIPKRFSNIQSVDDKIPNDIMDTLLPDDLKIFLFNKLRTKLQPMTKDVNSISMYLLNYDNIQIITALNDMEFLNCLIGKINRELIDYNKLSKEEK